MGCCGGLVLCREELGEATSSTADGTVADAVVVVVVVVVAVAEVAVVVAGDIYPPLEVR